MENKEVKPDIESDIESDIEYVDEIINYYEFTITHGCNECKDSKDCKIINKADKIIEKALDALEKKLNKLGYQFHNSVFGEIID